MSHLSAKNKIIIICLLWLGVSVLMLGFLFKLQDGSNQAVLDSMAQDRQNLAKLQAEDQSFKQAKADLDKLAAQPLQPQQFFSRDVSLVGEIQTLQNLGQQNKVQMQLNGVNGTINSLAPAPTKSSIVVVPYSISLSGSLANDMNFITSLEHLSFVTTVTGISVTAGGQGSDNISLGADFYLLKQ